MNEPGTHAPIAFDPVAGELPDGLLLPPRTGGEVVALLVDPGTGMDGWALRVGRGIARGWAGQGRDIVLIDVHVEEPALHRLLGEENAEGIADAIRFGVSRGRVTRSVEGEPFAFVSAGTVLPGWRQFWRSRRWGALLEGFRGEGRAVLLFLPAGDPDVGTVAHGADRSFWIGRADAPEARDFPSARAIVPPSSGPDAGAGSKRPPEGLTHASQESLGARPERGGGEPSPTVPKPAPTRPGGSRATGSSPGGPRRSRTWLLVLLLLVLVGLLVAHWFGVLAIPGLPARASAWLIGGPSTSLLSG